MTDLEKASVEAIDHAISVLEGLKDTLHELSRALEGKTED